MQPLSATDYDYFDSVTTTTAPSEDFTTVTAPEASTTTFTTLQVPTGIDCNDGNNGGCQHTCFYPEDATNDEDAECECDACFQLTNGFDCEPIPDCVVESVFGFCISKSVQYFFKISRFYFSYLEPL